MLNFFGVSMTKYTNAITRAMSTAAKTILVWTIGIIETATTNYKWRVYNCIR